MKRFFALLVLLLAVSLLFIPSSKAEELLQNGGFEELSSSGDPEHWYSFAYRPQAGYTEFRITDEAAHSGRYSAMIANYNANDARYLYTAKVEPNSLYRFSGYLLVDSMEDIGNGANFAIEGIYAFSDYVFDTSGEWKYLEWFGETSETQTELTVGVRLGGYSAESIGKVYFDDISLTKVEELPPLVYADLWYASDTQQASEPFDDEKAPSKNTVLYIVISLAYFMGVFILYKNLIKNSSAAHFLLYAALGAAVIIRFLLAGKIPGYQVDINCFTAWSLRLAESGPSAFYATDYFCDYPPGYMLLLWPIGILLRAFGSSQAARLFIVKLLPMLFDFAGAALIYRFGRKKLSAYSAFALSLLYALNPLVIVNSAAWGQADSVLAFFILLTAYYAVSKKWQIAIPLYFVSVLIKPQALLFAPIGGTAFLLSAFCDKDKVSRKAAVKAGLLGAAYSVLACTAVILPFSIHKEQPLQWIIGLYSDTVSSYNYATLNTANLYYLFGANWVNLKETVPLAFRLFLTVLFSLCSVYLWKTSLQRKMAKAPCKPLRYYFIFLSCLFAFFCFLKPSYSFVGYLLFASVYIVLLYFMYLRSDALNLPFAIAAALIGIYNFSVKIHERYLFCAIPLLIYAYILQRDKRLLRLITGYSATVFLNVVIILENSILFDSGHLNTDTLVLNDILCILNFLLCVYSFLLLASGLKAEPVAVPNTVQKKSENDRNQRYYEFLLYPSKKRPRLVLKDYIIMASVTVCYAVLAFTNLGSTVAPQTAWVSVSPDESVIFSLDRSYDSFSMLYYCGVSYNDFSVQISDDGVHWSEAFPCRMNEGLCYRWMYALKSYDNNGETAYYSDGTDHIVRFSGRYLKVNSCAPGLNLWEIVLRDEENRTIPIRIVDSVGSRKDYTVAISSPEHMIDEQDTCIGEPGWYNGTYFDEIYHARTAYEHLHGQQPYETTHPPLGKLLMSVSIAIFGMTPFGWRFAGALIGVLMLPVIYILAMQLIKKRSAALVAICALSLDLMHYTQTRIATIDSFPVFFIMLTYLFMVRYMQCDLLPDSEGRKKLFTKSFLKTWLPLFLCGICMGLSIACKWIGLYSACGLAILFFTVVYRQFRIVRLAYELDENDESFPPKQRSRITTAKELTVKRVFCTCGACVFFFILIPCVIYFLCYIPYLSPTGPVTLKRVINTQISMFQYHSQSGLGMDHPFQSQWWQWPFLLKPMWFAQDSYEPTGFASTIMCMGNPWIFYLGAFAILFCGILFVRNSLLLSDTVSEEMAVRKEILWVILIGFLAQYLPWILVPRSTYMYHYFASVPFIILATSYLLGIIKNQKLANYAIILYIVIAAVFFVMYFPYASGWLTRTGWLDSVKGFLRLYY